MSSTGFRIRLPGDVYDAMISQASREAPNECCGILAGSIDGETGARTAVRAMPLVNELASPRAYRSEPRSMLAAMREIDRLGMTQIAIYHSHPTAPPIPSRYDLADNFHGDDMVHIIVTLLTTPPTLMAWRLFSTHFEPVEIE
jgi:proteasome lid subunit RPN8/RPN11